MSRCKITKRRIAAGMSVVLMAGSLSVPTTTAYAAFHDEEGYQDTALALEIAEESMVLLKNEDQALPLAKGSKVAIFGTGQSFAWQAGALGSSTITSTYETDLINPS